MKKTLIIASFVCIVLAGVGYVWFSKQKPSGKVEEKMFDVILQQTLQHAVPEIGVEQLAAKKEDYTLLDSRTKKEYDISHLPNAIWISDKKSIQKQQTKDLSKDQPVVVYCSIGFRSEQAAVRLQEEGFTNVSNLYGGLFEWSNQAQPLQDTQGKPTKAVHGYSLMWAKWIRNGEVYLP